MKKILLVDDEPLITLSLSKMIERSGEDYQVTGMASNGQEALDFVKSSPVDIAIIDIRMPVLDGIGFLERVRQDKLPVQVIILSAYRDFGYAQQAIRYGVSAYLLKPLSQDALMKALTDVSRKVDQASAMKTASSLFTLQKRQQAVYQLLENGKCDAQLLPPALKTGERGCLLMAAAPLELPQPFIEDCQEFGWEPYRSTALILFLPDSQVAPERLSRLSEDIRAVAEEYFLPSLTIALSNGGFAVSELTEAAIQCKVASMYAFYLPDIPILTYSDVHLFSACSIRPLVSLFEELHECIRLSDANSIFEKLAQINESLKVEMSANPQTLYQLVYEMFTELARLEQKQSGTRVFSGITLLHLQNYTTLDTLHEYVVSLIREYFNGTKTAEINRDEQIVSAVREFCQQNYALDCTLDDIAAAVYISKSYLSQIFKEQCGVSLWNYFTDIRVGKAKELLANSNIKINRIGEMVGYPNPSHFGHIFRTHVGVTPKEYRDKIRGAAN